MTADVGATVRVSVTTTNPERSATATSNASSTVVGAGPVNTVAPAISGNAQRTVALTSTPGTWSGNQNTYAYQWQRSADGTNWVDIAGATGAGYELAVADVDAKVRLLVTATNPDGTSSRASAPTVTVKAAPPVNTALPVVTGATLRGTTLSASQGTWSGPGVSFAYQWQHDFGSGFTDIAGATGTTYLLGVADVGSSIRVRVTATNADASVSATSIDSSVVKGGQPVSTERADDLGHRQAHSHADVDAGRLGRDRERLRVPVAAPHERVVHGHHRRDRHDVHARLVGRGHRGPAARHRLQPRRRRSARSARPRRPSSRRRRATPASRPSRARRDLNETLTATPGDWTPAGADYAYAWQRDGVDIPGATGSTYTLGPADLGKSVRVKVTATNVDGSAERDRRRHGARHRAAREHGGPRRAVGNAAGGVHAHGRPRHLGHPERVLQLHLAALPGRCDRLTGCEEVGTGSTYTLSAADVGRRLGVRVVASSSGGTSTATSALTGTVVRLALRNLTPPSITGRAYVGETLNGDAGRWTFPSADADLRLAALRRGRHLQLRVGRRAGRRSTP